MELLGLEVNGVLCGSVAKLHRPPCTSTCSVTYSVTYFLPPRGWAGSPRAVVPPLLALQTRVLH